MSYIYDTGDGYSVLLPTEPADSDSVAVVGQAIRQIKLFLNDPAASEAAKANFAAAVAASQNVTANGVATHVNLPTETFDLGAVFNVATHIFTAPVAGIYQFSCFLFINGGTADLPNVRLQAWLGKNGLSLVQLGDYNNTTNVAYNAWGLRFIQSLQLAVNDTVELAFSASDGTGTGNVVITTGRFEGRLVNRV